MENPRDLKKSNVELLAPAKNFMALKASAPYADAIYFGVENFNMRMKADNFTIESLPRIADLCHNPSESHFRKRKAYLTVNILVYENELKQLENLISAAKNANIDAVIVHDLAAIQIARRLKMPFHISTQCNVTNSESARFYEELGAERIILARECSLKQIQHIATQMTTADIETFMHGAMCSSISGRCYLSQTLACSNKQSANRGLCTQPCRGEWKLTSQSGDEFIYDGQRIFNSRDLCMINYIPEMIEAGIKSFKIEGRMRHPHYVETVSRVYREAIDAYYNGNFEEEKKRQRWITQLKQVYNRGFTTGFYFHMANASDSQLKSPANVSHFRYIEMGRIQESFPSKVAKIKLENGSLSIGDEIIVMSTEGNGETYFVQKVEDIQMDGKIVQSTPKATKNNPVVLTTKLNHESNGKLIDAIYKFTEETYKSSKNNKKRKSTYNLN